MSFYLKHLKEQPETACVGTKWTSQEENRLIESLKMKRNIEDIAKEHKRTSGGIRSRMRHIAIKMINNDGKSLEEVCAILNMTSEEITDAQKRRANGSTPKPKIETELDVLIDIRKLLMEIKSKLH